MCIRDRAERWIQDVKEGFKAEKQHLDEKVKALEETATTRGRRTDDVGGDSDGTVHVPEASHAADMEGGVDGDDPGTVDDSTTREQKDSTTGDTGSGHSASTASSGSTVEGPTNENELVRTMTEFL